MARKLLTIKKKKLELPAPEKLEALTGPDKLEALTGPDKLEALAGPDKPVALLAEKTDEPPKPKAEVPPKPAKNKKQKNSPAEDSPRMVAARELLAKLIEEHPTLFPVDGSAPKAWKIDLYHDIRKRYTTSHNILKSAIGLWRRKENYLRYYQVLAAGGNRHDLDGNPVEPISEKDRESAERELNIIAMKAAAKKAKAAKKAAQLAAVQSGNGGETPDSKHETVFHQPETLHSGEFPHVSSPTS